MSKLAIIPIAAVMFAVWVVYLGGLAAMQSSCTENSEQSGNGTSSGATTISNNPGLDETLPCSKVYRLYWFYMVWELVVIIIIFVVAAIGKLYYASGALVGLLAVSLMMFIQASDVFLTAEDGGNFNNGQPLHRARTVTAGAIMVAVMNAIALLAVGYTEWFSIGHHHSHVENKPATTVVQTA